MEDVRIGPYRVLGPLGSGGMGHVYRAVHETLNREVAIKVIGDAARGEEAVERRFVREGRIASAVSHPALVRIFDVGLERGQLYLVMELVEGSTLDALLLRVGSMHWTSACAIGARVADALAALHAADVLHRDVKPSNVMVSADGAVKVLDLGLARTSTSTMITQTGEFVGTLRFVSPEVLCGEPPTPAADVWSLGCLIHELCTGRSLATQETTVALVNEIVNEGLRPLAQVKGAVPPAVVACVERCVDRDLSQRPSAAQARDLLGALLEALAGVSADELLAPDFEARCRVSPVARRAVAGVTPIGALAAVAAPDRTLPLKRARAPASAEPPSSRGSSGVPAGPQARRAFTAFAVGAAVALAMAFTLTPRPVGPVPARSVEPVRPGEPVRLGEPVGSPAPSPSPAERREPRRTPTYTELRAAHRQAIPRLQAGGDTAAKTVAELRRVPGGIDLGREPAHWLRWIQIAEWLDGGAAGDPPRPLRAQVTDGAVEEAELRLMLSDLSRYQNEASARCVSVAMRAVTATPRLGPGWLALGRLLELEGRPAPALGAYRAGLPLTSPEEMEQAPRLVWAGLARALVRVPGHAIEREWLAWVRGDHSEAAWVGLFEAVPDPELSFRLVRAAAEAPGGEMAALELGRMLQDRGDASEALLIWQRALRAVPRSTRLSERLVDYYLVRGELAPCRELRDARLLAADYEGVVDRCDPLVKPPYAPATQDRALTLELLDRIAAGDADGASQRLGPLARRVINRQDGRAAVLGALMGAGDAGRAQEMSALLAEGGFKAEVWTIAAGALAHAAGRPVFEAAYAAAQGTEEPGRLAAIRALWCLRNSRFDEARHILAGTGEVSRKLLAAVAAELTTALLMAGQAPLTLAEVPELARKHDPATRLVAAVAAGHHDEAMAAAWECWADRPSESAWGLVCTRLAVFASPASAPPERLAKLEIAERYLSVGLWMTRAMDEARGKKRGGLLGGDRPRKLSDERVR